MHLFELDKFTLHIPDELLDLSDMAADEFFLKTNEGLGHWTIHFGDPVEYEIKLVLENNFVESYHCDCESFRHHQICFHIAGAIKEIYNAVKTPGLQSQKTQDSVKIHLATLLNQLSENELKDFILQYSRTDKRIALELKSRFAYKINTSDNRKKYLSLINQFAGTRKTENLSNSDLKRLGSYCENLLALSDDIQTLGNLPESYSIISALLFFVNQRALPCKNDVFECISVEIHHRINLLLNRDAAPMFKQFIFNDVATVLSEADYVIPSGEINLFKILLNWKGFHSFEKLAFEKLSGIIERRISDSLRPELTFLEWCIDSGLPREIELIHRVFDKRPEFVDLCLNTLIEKDKVSNLMVLLEKIYSETPNKITKYKCFRAIENYYMNHSKKKLLEHRLDFYKVQPEIRLFLTLKKTSGKSWSNLKERIIKEFEKEGRKEDLALLYSWDEDTQGLIDHIGSTRSLSLLNKHIPKLYPHFPYQTIQLYKEWLSQYLETHIGPRSASQVNDVMNRLKQCGFNEGVNELRNYLSKKFDERSLANALRIV